METQLITPDHLQDAAAIIRRGGLVAFPTETVYGLGADVTQEEAVSQIFKAKGRPQDNPLIIHVASKHDVKNYVESIPAAAEKLMDIFWPGSLTIILKHNGKVAPAVTGGLSTVGVRLPSDDLARQLIQMSGTALAAPSANRSGRPSPTRWEHVQVDLSGRIDAIVQAGATQVGVESTVLDLSTGHPIILRPGAVSREQIEAVIGPVAVSGEVGEVPDAPRSPGMKYTHYSPDVPVWMVGADFKQAALRFKEDGSRIGLLADRSIIEQLAEDVDATFSLGDRGNIGLANHFLYEGLRTLERAGVDVILAQKLDDAGVGAAYMNRLEKASGGKALP